MAEDDIYKSKEKYEAIVENLDKLLEKPKGKRKYYCKNKANLEYFKEIIKYFELKDLTLLIILAVQLKDSKKLRLKG